MKKALTRRDFIKISGLGVGGVAAVGVFAPIATPAVVGNGAAPMVKKPLGRRRHWFSRIEL